MAAVKVPHSKHLPLSKKTAGVSHRITPGPCAGGGGAEPAGVWGSAAIPNHFSHNFWAQKSPK